MVRPGRSKSEVSQTLSSPPAAPLDAYDKRPLSIKEEPGLPGQPAVAAQAMAAVATASSHAPPTTRRR